MLLEAQASAPRYTLKLDRYSSHRQIATWLQHYKAQTFPHRPGVVYDIGCAQGFLGQLLPAADFTLFGAELDPASAAAARQWYQVVQQANIEEPLTLKFPQPADVLVLADVLEHTRDPKDCLTRLCQTCLAPSACVIISLPNVAHLWVRLSLLLGRFEYAARGILDETHLRFFTRASAARLIQGCGITLKEIATTPVPLPLVNPAFSEGRGLWPLHQLNAASARLLPTLLGFQNIFYGFYRP